MYKLTLNFPTGCKHFRDTVRTIHKWRSYSSIFGPISFTGGIFQNKDNWGRVVFHAHLCLLTTVSEMKLKAMSAHWQKITKLPSSSFDLEPIKNLGDWLHYVFIKNCNECIGWKLTYYRQEFLAEIFNHMEKLSK
jgi:hypothetical protein